MAVAAEADGGVNGLKQAAGVDAGNDEAALVDGFRTLRRGADAHGGEGMAHRGEETALLGKGAGVGNDREGIHLKAVVVVKAERFMLDYALVELEATGSKAVAAARMRGRRRGGWRLSARGWCEEEMNASESRQRSEIDAKSAEGRRKVHRKVS